MREDYARRIAGSLTRNQSEAIEPDLARSLDGCGESPLNEILRCAQLSEPNRIVSRGGCEKLASGPDKRRPWSSVQSEEPCASEGGEPEEPRKNEESAKGTKLHEYTSAAFSSVPIFHVPDFKYSSLTRVRRQRERRAPLIGLGDIKTPNHAKCGVRGLVGAVLKVAEQSVGPAGLKVDS